MARFTVAEGRARTHNVQWVDAKVIVEEVLWVVWGKTMRDVEIEWRK